MIKKNVKYFFVTLIKKEEFKKIKNKKFNFVVNFQVALIIK